MTDVVIGADKPLPLRLQSPVDVNYPLDTAWTIDVQFQHAATHTKVTEIGSDSVISADHTTTGADWANGLVVVTITRAMTEMLTGDEKILILVRVVETGGTENTTIWIFENDHLDVQPGWVT